MIISSQVQPARVLSHLYTYLGRNKKLGLSGRKSRDVGILSTSKLYSLKDRVFAFTPQVTQDLTITIENFILKTNLKEKEEEKQPCTAA